MRVAVVLDDVDHRQLPELRHVEALVDLALVGGAVAEIGQATTLSLPRYLLAKARPVPSETCAPTMPWPPIEALLDGEHVHRAALAFGIAAAAAGQLGHDALGVHAAGQHVAVIAVAGDDCVARLERPSACRPRPLPGRYRGGRSRRSGPCRTSGRPSPRSGGSAACRDRPSALRSLPNSAGAASAGLSAARRGAADAACLLAATAMALLELRLSVSERPS